MRACCLCGPNLAARGPSTSVAPCAGRQSCTMTRTPPRSPGVVDLVTLPQDARLLCTAVRRELMTAVESGLRYRLPSDRRGQNERRDGFQDRDGVLTSTWMWRARRSADGHVFAFCELDDGRLQFTWDGAPGEPFNSLGELRDKSAAVYASDDGAHIAYMGVRGESQFVGRDDARIQLSRRFPFRSPDLRWRGESSGIWGAPLGRRLSLDR